ncbi:MAG: terminase [Chitinophagaceae bacterium]|nr:MAG: terminase [Chitinophagaceae bacterium]
MAKLGRVSTYTDEIATEIVERLSEGEPLRKICRSAHMPAWRTVYAWMQANHEFAARIARARDVGFDAIAEETLAIVDSKPKTHATEFGPKVDPAYVQWQKNRAEQRMKLLAKWSPKKYGEKVQQEHSGTLTLAQLVEAANGKREDDASGD